MKRLTFALCTALLGGGLTAATGAAAHSSAELRPCGEGRRPASARQRKERTMFTTVRRRRMLLAALLGAILAALGITVASSRAEPGRSRDEADGRIVVTHVSFRHECCAQADDILTMRPDGSDPRQLTHNDWGQASEEPAWGKHNWIYFDSGPVDGLEHLFRINANGHGLTQITHGDGSECCVAPSPDGKLIAFDGFFPAVAPDGAQGIYLTDQNGGSHPDFRRLTVAPAGGFEIGRA